ncbi:MAG: hypothetical protein AB2693_29270 [Candidatus Thiodiazotropha sp.]
MSFPIYRKNALYWDRWAYANSAGIDQQSDQCKHCLPFQLHLLMQLLHYKSKLFRFSTITVTFLGFPIFRFFTVPQFLKQPAAIINQNLSIAILLSDDIKSISEG